MLSIMPCHWQQAHSHVSSSGVNAMSRHMAYSCCARVTLAGKHDFPKRIASLPEKKPDCTDTKSLP